MSGLTSDTLNVSFPFLFLPVFHLFPNLGLEDPSPRGRHV